MFKNIFHLKKWNFRKASSTTILFSLENIEEFQDFVGDVVEMVGSPYCIHSQKILMSRLEQFPGENLYRLDAQQYIFQMDVKH